MCDILEAPERSASRGQDSAKYKGQVKKTAGRGNKEGVCDLEGSQWNCGDGNMIQADSPPAEEQLSLCAVEAGRVIQLKSLCAAMKDPMCHS